MLLRDLSNMARADFDFFFINSLPKFVIKM
jgi:hypothetical protein